MMKILYFFKEQDTPMFQWQKKHIINELEINGHQVTIFNPLYFNNIDQANEMLLKELNNKHFDLFMTPHNQDVLYIDTLKMIKLKSIPTLLICFDNLIIPFNFKKISHVFDLVWLTSLETKYLFDKWGANSIFLPYAANPNFLKPTVGDEIPRISFIGNPYGSRIYRINSLLKNNIDLSIHSNHSNIINRRKISSKREYANVLYNYMRFPIGRKVAYAALKQKIIKNEVLLENRHLKLEDPIPLNQMNVYLSRYALCLSFSDTRSTGLLKNPVPIVNLRSFEIPMAGGLQISTYSNELANYFEEDKEIILCKSNEEYIEKSKFYLKDSSKSVREKMKINARKRAIAEHTWISRFNEVFDKLEIKKNQ